MIKNKLIIILTIVIVTIIIAIYFIFTNTDKEPSKAIKAVPTNAAIILEASQIDDIIYHVINDNLIWNELKNIKSLKMLKNNMFFLDSIINVNTDVYNILNNKPVIISTHILGKKGFEFLFLIQIGNKYNEKRIKKILERNFNEDIFISVRTYNKSKIFDVVFKSDSLNNFSYSFSKGIFIISYAKILVENAIRQLDSKKSYIDDNNFLKIQNTASKSADANIYINYDYFLKLTGGFLNNKKFKFIKQKNNFAHWTEFDLSLKKDAILLSGISLCKDSAYNFMTLFKNQKPQNNTIIDILPNNTSSFTIFNISDNEKFRKDYEIFLNKNKIDKNYNENIKNINDEFNINIKSVFNNLFNNEFAFVSINPNISSKRNENFSIILTNDKYETKNKLLEITKKHALKNNIDIKNLKHKCNIDEKTTIYIYSNPIKNINKIIIDGVFDNLSANFYTFYEDFLIYGESQKSLENFVKKIYLNKILTDNKYYNKFSKYISSKSNIYIYSDINKSLPLYSDFLKRSIYRDLLKNSSIFSKFQAFAIQFSGSNGGLFNNFYLKYLPDYKKSIRINWETKLDSLLAIKPVFVKNHNTGDNEIFVQDLSNKIYLINKYGKILWSRKLKNRIIGNIYQVDLFKNKKLQLFFNTENRIFLIDRNGKNVEKYPIKLKAKATNSVSIVDYDNNMNYRFFIACSNKKVYVYDKKGKILDGWKFKKTKSLITSSIQHIKSDNKDYIIFGDKNKIYILNRKGEERVKLKINFAKSINNKFYFEKKTDKSKARIVTSNNKGEVIFIYLDGSLKKMSFEKYSDKHKFSYIDISGDNKSDFVFLDKNVLYVFDRDKSEILEYKFDKDVINNISFYKITNERQIAISSKTKNQIYLINKEGELNKNFPIIGYDNFSIGRFSQKSKNTQSLIVGANDNYIINYLIHK